MTERMPMVILGTLAWRIHLSSSRLNLSLCPSAEHPWIEEALDRFFAKAEAEPTKGIKLQRVLKDLREERWVNHKPGKEEVILTAVQQPDGSRAINASSLTIFKHNEDHKGAHMVQVWPHGWLHMLSDISAKLFPSTNWTHTHTHCSCRAS